MHAVQLAVKQALGQCNGKVLLGVSGGLDSMVLLDAAASVSAQTQTVLVVAHLDHALRAVSSQDAAFVAAACQQRGVTLHSQRIPVQLDQGESLEMAARRVRMQFFLDAAQQLGARWLLLGHHADDQAETVLWRLFRGVGSTGLSAMASPAPFPIQGGPQIIRPLINITRDQIEQYSKHHGVAHIQDQSNQDIAMLRNRIRHQLLPLLKRDYDVNVTTLGVTARLLGDEDTYLAQQAQHLLQTCTQGDGIDVARMQDAPVALVRRALLQWLQRHTQQPIGFRHVEAVRGLQRGSLDLPGGLRVICHDGLLMRAHDTQVTPPPLQQPYCVHLLVPGTTLVPGGTLKAMVADGLPAHVPVDTVFVDGDQLKNVCVRPRMPGDRYHLLGAPGSKKLKDVLIDRKVATHRRQGPVVANNTQVLWMPGLPPSQYIRIKPDTRCIIQLKWHAD